MASSSPIRQNLILFSENIIQTHQHRHSPDRQCRDLALILLEDCTQNRDEHVDKHADYDTANIIIHEDGYQPHAGNRKKFYWCKIKALCSLKKRDANDNQCSAGDHQEQRADEAAQQEEEACCNCRKAGTSACLNSGGRLCKGADRGNFEEGADET